MTPNLEGLWETMRLWSYILIFSIVRNPRVGYYTIRAESN